MSHTAALGGLALHLKYHRHRSKIIPDVKKYFILFISISVLAGSTRAGDVVNTVDAGKSPDGQMVIGNVKPYYPPQEEDNHAGISHFEIHDSKGKLIASQYNFDDLYEKGDGENFCFTGASEATWRADSRYVVFSVQVGKHSDRAVLLEKKDGKIRRIQLPDLGFIDCLPSGSPCTWDNKGYLHLSYENGYKAYNGDSQEVVVKIPDGSTNAIIVQKSEIQHDPDRHR